MAKKSSTVYVCSKCGAEFSGWYGKCPECESWNSIVEEVRSLNLKNRSAEGRRTASSLEKPVPITQAKRDNAVNRYSTGYSEFDNVLGGGIVAGSLNLISGDPGIGKSTLLLQTANKVASQYGIVLYVSGEESTAQVKMRGERISSLSENILLVSETNLDVIENYITELKPKLVIIDSIQCMYNDSLDSAPGTVSQIRECTSTLMRLAKGDVNSAFFIVCHVTKEGNIGGPRALEHMVDTVLYFEGERHNSFRILRGYKNRFGSTNEIGAFEMKNKGLEEVKNPSEMFLSYRDYEVSGSTITCILEGTRPVLLEIQALASKTHAEGTPPRRLGAGVDYNRMSIIIAVLEKQAKQNMFSYDIFINTAGGIKVTEPAADLAIAMAIVSSKKGRSIEGKTIFLGEISLTGEIRPVNAIEKRINEASKMGYNRVIIPNYNFKELEDVRNNINNVKIIGVKDIAEAVNLI